MRAHRPVSRVRLLILMCAATADFISNNDNHSTEESAKKTIFFANGEYIFQKEKKKPQLFASVRIFCPTKKKTYKIEPKRKTNNKKNKTEMIFLSDQKRELPALSKTAPWFLLFEKVETLVRISKTRTRYVTTELLGVNPPLHCFW